MDGGSIGLYHLRHPAPWREVAQPQPKTKLCLPESLKTTKVDTCNPAAPQRARKSRLADRYYANNWNYQIRAIQMLLQCGCSLS